VDVTKNGGAPAANLLTTSWMRERTSEGPSRFTLYAMMTPVQQAVNSIEQAHPRMAGAPMVVGQAVIDVPNLEIAKLLLAGLNEMLSKQPSEIVQVGR
jgi:hypothetical protein